MIIDIGITTVLANTNNVLVTGSSGYIGNHICKELKLAGYTVVGVDLIDPSKTKYLDKFYSVDYSDPVLANILRDHKISKIVHTAATSLVGPSISNPNLYYTNNVANMRQFLEMCTTSHVKKIVYSSSAAVYGDTDKSKLDESQVPEPCNPYGRTKLVGEWMLEDWCRANGLQAVALRYFNVCGADSAGEFGQTGIATHIIAVALQRVLQGQAIVINGDDYNTKDGTCVRDYVHVTDVARANRLALETSTVGFVVANIANAVGFSNLEIVRGVCEHTGLDLAWRFGPRRSGDPAMLIANNNQAKNLLHWIPEHSTLENIIKTAYRWHSQTT